ncbi:LTA synthase family protein [uncultured Clostridium sp.]|uniref:LTA synthase family protein n=1 Tax=uncultured Clostridium sp. TaxID=59620 RepID=UPI00261AF0D0|nr:LTA synthase family protein [uncultured Clostridium sp.]
MLKESFNKRILLNILTFIVCSFLLTFLIEWISRGDYLNTYEFLHHQFSKFIYNVLVVSVTLSLCFLFKRRLFSFSIISIIWLILGVGNNLLIKFRETPLTYADLGMINNALELSNQYLNKSSLILILTIFIFILLGLTALFFKCKKIKVNYMRNISCLLLFFISFFALINYGLKKDIITRSFWDIKQGYESYGFCYSFYNSLVNTGIHKPNGYSKNKISNIKNNLTTIELKNSDSLSVSSNAISKNNDLIDIDSTSNKNDTIIKPNIIIVQLESFINPNWITNVKFNKNPVSNLEYYSKNFSSGLLTVPAMGGGTANTEFEIITGMSTEFFGVGEFPYNTICSKSPIPSLAYTLKNLGYTSNSLHNHDGKFYSRYKVYKNLGFDSFTPIESMPIPEKTPFGWAKDNILINEICNILSTTNSPDLIFGISVQGHGTYPNTPLENNEISIINGYDKENRNSLEYYVNQIYEMDIFIDDLIKAVNSLNEPSVIIFYGDHFPALGISSNEISEATLKETPYFIWDNMNLDVTNKNIHAYELTSLVMDKISFPVTTLSLLHNTDLDNETKKEYLNQLQYDMIYGKNYNNEFLKLTPSDNYKIGFKDVIINKIEFEDTNINIIGSNFNTFSKVFVNNKEIPTNFINENTLSINKSDCPNNSIINVSQLASCSSTVFSSSNEIVVNY